MRVRIVAVALAVGVVVAAGATSYFLEKQTPKAEGLPPVEWIILKPGDPLPKDLRQKPKQLPDEWFMSPVCTDIKMISRSGCKKSVWA